jgi:hypothetical protein
MGISDLLDGIISHFDTQFLRLSRLPDDESWRGPLAGGEFELDLEARRWSFRALRVPSD